MGEMQDGIVRSLTPRTTQRSDDRSTERLREQLTDLVDRMSDEQILGLADSLHAALRARRELRHRVGRRLRDRAGGGEA
jgi:hypothetical protein